MTKKIIRIPERPVGYDELVNSYLGIIDTPQFQRLRDVNQLDLIYKVYPGAKHSRFEHSLGVLHHERNIIKGIQSDDDSYKFSILEKKALELAALLHDINHPPDSHATEYVLMAYGEPSHDEKSLKTLEILEPKIKKLFNSNDRKEGFELLVNIFKRKAHMCQTIWGIVGSDVFDYINRDADRCGVRIGSDTDRIETYAFFDGKKYGIDSRVRQVVRNHVESYLHMYFEVYNRKACSLWKGVLRRGLYEGIKTRKLKPRDIWDMTDFELFSSLAACGGLAKKCINRIRDREKAATFLSLKIKGQESQEEVRKKPIEVVGLPEEELISIAKKFENIENAIEFERSIENELGFEPGDITLAEMPHIKMIQPQDIPLYDIQRGWTSLFQEMPESEYLFNLRIREEYAIRVGVISPLRKKANRKAKKVLSIMESL